MKPQQPSRVYVISANGRALVAFEAASRREASELCKELWFREELLLLRSESAPIWNGEDPLSARTAEPQEIQEFQKALVAVGNQEVEGIFLAYLMPLDGSG